MKIQRIILKKARNFIEFDHSFEDSWTGETPEAILLSGPNGSGKTTLLNMIAEVWQGLGAHLRGETELQKESKALANIELAAVEFIGLERDPIWIGAASDEAGNTFVAEHVNQSRLMLLRSHAPGLQYLRHLAPGEFDLHTAASPSDWQSVWTRRLTENLLGKRNDLPNMVLLESEMRSLLPLEEKFSVQPETEEFRWLARYEPATSRRGSLQNYLYNLKVVDEKTYAEIIDQANSFLTGKRLAEFDRRSGDLTVRIENGDHHPITELSSGEKQVLLMLATITRWLKPGGIVLIDEPDLHLHVTLATAFVDHLRRMVAAKEGQLIIASHAPELWSDFAESRRLVLGRTEEIIR